MTLEQVEEAKLLGVTLDGQLSWSSQIDKVVVKMGAPKLPCGFPVSSIAVHWTL